MSINSVKRSIQKDIDEIKLLLGKENVTKEELTQLHLKVDNKYQSKIRSLGKSCYNWDDKYGFDYNNIGIDALKHNLLCMENKLEGYLQTFGLDQISPSGFVNVSTYNSINNKNENITIIEVDFKKIENNINNNDSLTSEETKEVLERLKELKEIYYSNESRKNKWEKLRKILLWLLNKSVDVAIQFIPVVSDIITKKVKNKLQDGLINLNVGRLIC